MDVKANIVAQNDSNQNTVWKSRLLESDVGEDTQCEGKNDTELTTLTKPGLAPRFVVPPKDTYILSGETGLIEARIYSFPKPVVRWYKNGKLITSSMLPKIKKHHHIPETYQLEIPEAGASDMGSYTCVARNCYGSITSSATLRIIDLETDECPRFVKRLQRTDIVAESCGRLDVKVAGVPKPKVEWFKDSMPLKENKRIKICHIEPQRYVVRFNNAEPEDSGLYTCQASNASGSSSTSAMVYVEKIENLNKRWAEDLACQQLEKRQCPNGWSLREFDEHLYRITLASYHIKYRMESPGYRNLFPM